MVIYTRGDHLLPDNCRSIAIIPILCRLLSRMVCNRLKQRIAERLNVDKAAYRKSSSTEDHMCSMTLLVERCAKRNTELRAACIDFLKALDAIEHDMLFAALSEFRV